MLCIYKSPVVVVVVYKEKSRPHILLKDSYGISMGGGGVLYRYFEALFLPLPVDLMKKNFNHISMKDKKSHSQKI